MMFNIREIMKLRSKLSIHGDHTNQRAEERKDLERSRLESVRKLNPEYSRDAVSQD